MKLASTIAVLLTAVGCRLPQTAQPQNTVVTDPATGQQAIVVNNGQPTVGGGQVLQTGGTAPGATPALGVGWAKISIPVPKLFAVPNQQPQAPMLSMPMNAGMMGQPMMGGYGMMGMQQPMMGMGNDPQSALAMAAMLKMAQNQKAQNTQRSPANSQNAAALNKRAEELEGRLKRLQELLEAAPSKK